MSKLLDTIFKNNYSLSKLFNMKIQINETTTKTVEIKLPTPKYVRFHDTMYFKFHEVKEQIITTRFDFNELAISQYPFCLQISTNLNLENFEAADQTKYTIITGGEFYGKLQELMAKYSITHITPDFSAPTLFLQEENNHLTYKEEDWANALKNLKT